MAIAAEPLPLQLDWTAPSECPTGDQVERELVRITRVRPERTLVPLQARAVLVRETGGYRLTLDVSQGEQTRRARFDSETCPPLQKAATLVLALAFGDGIELTNGSSASDEARNERAAEAAATRAPAPTSAERNNDSSADSGSTARLASPVHAVPWVGMTASSGFVSATAAGADLGLNVGARHWAAFARASLFPPAVAAHQESVSAELSALFGSAGFCGRASWDQLRLDACLALEAGALRARSTGAVRDGSASIPWLAVSPLLSALVPVTRPFALRAELAAAVPFSAPRYDVAPYGTLYATSRFVPRVSLGVAVEL